jgi:replication-associated recombination protein RarA
MSPQRSMPRTRHNLDALSCVSAMQKAIRRADERLAMEFACELVNTSRSYCTTVAGRLEIISHEDVDAVGFPAVVPFVATCAQQARDWYQPDNPGKSRMAIGSAIRLLCVTPKSREGDHFQAAIGLRNLLTPQVPVVPDYALDMHTAEGRRLGRGLDHFRAVGAVLAGNPSKDEYEDEAYAMWAMKRNSTATTSLFNGELDD